MESVSTQPVPDKPKSPEESKVKERILEILLGVAIAANLALVYTVGVCDPLEHNVQLNSKSRSEPEFDPRKFLRARPDPAVPYQRRVQQLQKLLAERDAELEKLTKKDVPDPRVMPMAGD